MTGIIERTNVVTELYAASKKGKEVQSMAT